jgi:lipopolysaccharide exporter
LIFGVEIRGIKIQSLMLQNTKKQIAYRKDVSLKYRAIKSGFWAGLLRVAEKGFITIRLIFLARILAPRDFGLIGITLLIISILETFSQTGFQEALIQKKEKVENFLDVAWTILALRGFVLFNMLFFAAPYFSSFFNVPEAIPIIRTISFVILLNGLNNIAVVYFQKELQFNKQFLFQLSGVFADFIVSISAAIILKNVWALVFGVLACYLTRFIVSYLILPYRPRINFDLKKGKELFGFGKWIFGSTVLIFMIMQGSDIFVGKILGVAALGFYQIAYRLSNIPATEISNVISKVTFPAYSKLQNDMLKLKEGFYKTVQFTVFISMPLTGGIFILAPQFVMIFLGPKWMPIITAMQILVFWGMIRSIASTMSPIFNALALVKIVTLLSALKLIILAILIYPLTINFGIVGTSIAVLISSICITPITCYIVIKRIFKSSFVYFLKITLLIPAISTILMVSILSLSVIRSDSLPNFILLVFSGASIYLLSCYVLDRYLKYGMIDNLKLVRAGLK